MFLCAIFLPIASLSAAFEVSAVLNQIPTKDRRVLDDFFQILFRQEPFAYTLFGSKPMSIASYFDSKQCVGKEISRSFLFENGWNVWTKYQHLFPSQNFLFKIETNDSIIKSNTIYLINKPMALKVIAEHLSLFQKQWGKELLPEQLLDRLCDPDAPVQCDQDILGILLGFGEQNALLFHRWAQIIRYFEARMTPPFSIPQEFNLIDPDYRSFVDRAPRKWKLPDNTLSPACPSFSNYAEELNAICRKRASFEMPGSDFFLDFVASPSFVDHREDPALVHSYLQTRLVLRQTYQQGNFLEVTLQQWCD